MACADPDGLLLSLSLRPDGSGRIDRAHHRHHNTPFGFSEANVPRPGGEKAAAQARPSVGQAKGGDLLGRQARVGAEARGHIIGDGGDLRVGIGVAEGRHRQAPLRPRFRPPPNRTICATLTR